GVTYPESIPRMPRAASCEHTGNPVRDSVLNADRGRARAAFGLPADAVVLLVFGGSRGSRRVNEAVLRLRERLLAIERVWVLHVTGRAESLPGVDAGPEPHGGGDADRYRVFDYIDDMGAAIAAADLVIARAGATSIAEITAIGRAAVLVPYPYATGDHQTLNARDVAERGGALIVSDAGVDTDDFARALEDLLSDEDRRAEMARASRAIGVRDAATRLESLIVRCGGAGDGGGA
ncbi:MAG TPA: glycosyltransferase, partial [Coriobacteriia bacterium]|nr:glycosyltransferase [Coriobacteriia bacterium]